MAGQTVTLEVPEEVYRWAERTARTTERDVEAVLVAALHTTYEQALALRPEPPDTWQNKGVVLEQSGQPSEALTALPPPLEQVPDEWREELEALETLSVSALLQVAREGLTKAQVRHYDRLLENNRQGTLTARQRSRLAHLRHAADRIMLRRARAYVLLKWRGYNVADMIVRAE